MFGSISSGVVSCGRSVFGSGRPGPGGRGGLRPDGPGRRHHRHVAPRAAPGGRRRRLGCGYPRSTLVVRPERGRSSERSEGGGQRRPINYGSGGPPAGGGRNEAAGG
jgi:hypothetical protein